MSEVTRELIRIGEPERRALSVDDFEVRSAGKDLTLTGYASVFEYHYDIGGGPSVGGWSEVVDRRAFDQTLKQRPTVQLLVNHDSTPLARTKGGKGTLVLGTDAKGLHVEATLDTASPLVQTVRSAMERGDMDEMSFAFRTVRHHFNDETGERRLLELNLHNGDVSIVNLGASDATSAQIRGVIEALEVLGGLDADAALAEIRSIANPTVALHHAQQAIGSLLRTVGAPRLSVADAEAIIAQPR